jgi:hypothetical protein
MEQICLFLQKLIWLSDVPELKETVTLLLKGYHSIPITIEEIRQELYMKKKRNMKRRQKRKKNKCDIIPKSNCSDVTEEFECVICLEDVQCSEKTSCGHSIHNSCIESWKLACVRQKLPFVCPCCRKCL